MVLSRKAIGGIIRMNDGPILIEKNGYTANPSLTKEVSQE